MIALIELAYLAYWLATFSTSLNDGNVYRQRLTLTAAMIMFLVCVGHYASKELGAVLCGWAIAAEVWCFVCNFLDLDERLFSRKAKL